MDKRIFAHLQIAAQISLKKKDLREYYVGAVGIRKDGVWVQSFNGAPDRPCWNHHAEARLIRKLDVGSTVYVGRVRKDGSMGMAKPCASCARLLEKRGVKKVYYSIANNQYGIWTLARGHRVKEVNVSWI